MSLVVVLPTEPVTRDDRERGLPAHVAREVGEALRRVGHPHEGKAGGRRRVAVDEGRAARPAPRPRRGSRGRRTSGPGSRRRGRPARACASRSRPR